VSTPVKRSFYYALVSRNSTEEVVILRVRPVGEIHASVRMLSRSSGLLDAMAYGARSRKGGLRGAVVPFAVGTCYRYSDPVKGSSKITDLSVADFHPEIRENLKKYYVASLWAEVVLASYAAGSEGEAVWALLTEALALLSSGEEEAADLLNLQFIWRFLDFLGMRPELPASPSGIYQYLPEEHRFLTRQRGEVAGAEGDASQGGRIILGGGSLAYLLTSQARSLADSLRLRLSSLQRGELKALLFRLIQEASERELKTIRSGEGIL
jgi:DNA repair protein RecO